MSEITKIEDLKQIVSGIVNGKQINSVYFVGCGASRSDLYPAWYFLNNNAKRLRTSLHTANEFCMCTPAAVDETAIVITCSLSGTTPETVKATTVAKQHGANTVAITHDGTSPMTADADTVVTFGWSTAYSSKEDKMIKVLLLAAEILDQVEGYAHLADMYVGAEKVLPLIDKGAASLKDEAKVFAENYKDAPIIYVTSSGATQETAWSFAACLMMEMQWIPASTFNDGDFFHGPFEMVEKDAPYLLFMNDGSTRPMDARAMTFIQRFDGKLTVIDAKDFGLGGAVPGTVKDYFNPVLIGGVARVLAEAIADARNHPLTKRRYMWKLEY